jgi:drug/metabolite transporter (DMT)-like permease
MRAPPAVLAFLAVGLLAASQSGNIIRLADAHPLAIAAWRLVIASALLSPLAGGRMRSLGTLTAGQWGLLVAAAVALSAHFVTFIAAVQMTTVANATVFFSVNPVFTATAAFLIFGERAGWRLVAATALGIVGIVVIALGDLKLSPDQLPGDAMAVLCSALFTTYFLLGKRLRPLLDNRVYVTALYGIAGVLTFPLLLALDLPVVEHDRTTWLAFLLMALVPTMVGHTSMNLALGYLPAGLISVLVLSEPVFAGLVAWLAWGEGVTARTVVGYLLITASVVVVVWRRGARA